MQFKYSLVAHPQFTLDVALLQSGFNAAPIRWRGGEDFFPVNVCVHTGCGTAQAHHSDPANVLDFYFCQIQHRMCHAGREVVL